VGGGVRGMGQRAWGGGHRAWGMELRVWSVGEGAWRRELVNGLFVHFQKSLTIQNTREESMAKFRFMDLEIWKMAHDISLKLFDIADELEMKRLYRFAEQLRGAALGMTNNIAEGSGSLSNKDFIQFLNYARRSTFENANIIIMLHSRKKINEKTMNQLLDELEILSKKITMFQKSLR